MAGEDQAIHSQCQDNSRADRDPPDYGKPYRRVSAAILLQDEPHTN